MSTDVERLLVRVEATQRQFERQLKSMNRTTKKSTTKMERDFARSNKRSAASFKKLGNTAHNVLSGRLLRGAGLVGAITLIGVASLEAAKRGEKLLIIERRLEAITGSGERAEASLDAILQVARLTGTSIDVVAGAFSRYTLAAQEIGATTQEVETLTRTILELGVIGGGTQAELSAGAQQLGQSLAKGVLNGDELRSVMENMPLVARAIAEGLGVSVGKLKEMGAAGELTSRKVFDALLAGADEANAKFETMPLTIERGSTRMVNAFNIALAKINEMIGASSTLAGIFDGIAFGIERASASGIQKKIQKRQFSIFDSVNRRKKIRDDLSERKSSLFSSKKRNANLEAKALKQIAELNRRIKIDLASINEFEQKITDQKDQQQDYEKAKGITTGQEKAGKAEIAALQKIEDRRALNALDKRTQAGQKARDAAIADLKAASGFATKAQLQNVGRRAEQEALGDFDNKANRKSGGKAARKATKELLDFFADMEAQQQAIRDEIDLIGLSQEAIVRLEAKQQLLAAAKKKGLDLDVRSAETGKTLREEIDAQAESIGRLIEKQQSLNDQHDFWNNQIDNLKDGLVDAIVEGESFEGVLGNIAKAIAKAALQAALFNEGPLKDLFGKGGGLFNVGGGGSGASGTILNAVGGGGLFSGSFVAGFDNGGYTGNKPKSQPAGVVHGGEYVFSKQATDAIGLPTLEALHRGGIRGFMDGGFVGGGPSNVSSPRRIPMGGISPSKIDINVNIQGANGDQHVIDLVQQGVSLGMSQVRQEVPGILEKHQKEFG